MVFPATATNSVYRGFLIFFFKVTMKIFWPSPCLDEYTVQFAKGDQFFFPNRLLTRIYLLFHMLLLSSIQLLEQVKNTCQIIHLEMATYYTLKIIRKQASASQQKSEHQKVLNTGKILNCFAFFSPLHSLFLLKFKVDLEPAKMKMILSPLTFCQTLTN